MRAADGIATHERWLDRAGQLGRMRALPEERQAQLVDHFNFLIESYAKCAGIKLPVLEPMRYAVQGNLIRFPFERRT